MSYNLFLDDVKIPTDCKKYLGDGSIYDTEEFKIARNFDEFYKIIKENGLPKFVSFDYKLDTKETGLDCAEFLKFYCEDGNFEIPKYRVHSSFPLIFKDFDKILKKQIQALQKHFEMLMNSEHPVLIAKEMVKITEDVFDFTIIDDRVMCVLNEMKNGKLPSKVSELEISGLDRLTMGLVGKSLGYALNI